MTPDQLDALICELLHDRSHYSDSVMHLPDFDFEMRDLDSLGSALADDPIVSSWRSSKNVRRQLAA